MTLYTTKSRCIGKEEKGDTLKGEDPENILVRYLPDIKRFHLLEHSLVVIPIDFKVAELYILTLKSMLRYLQNGS